MKLLHAKQKLVFALAVADHLDKTLASAFDTIIVVQPLHSFTPNLVEMVINSFIGFEIAMTKNGKIIAPKKKWVYPYSDHPSDKLQIKMMLDEKIKGRRIIGLEAKIEPGRIHQLHTHDTEYVLVYCTKGKCKVTIGKKTKVVNPHTMIFIPPNVPHRFENKFANTWEGVAFAIGNKSKIKNIWMDK